MLAISRTIHFLTILLIGLSISLTSCDDDDSATPSDNNETDANTLSLKTSPDTLIESDEMEATLTFELTEAPPQEGIEAPLSVVASDGSSKPLARFKIASFDPNQDIQGGTLAEQPDQSTLNRFVLKINEKTATVTLTTNDDSFDNGPLNVSFTILESDGYEIDPDFKTGTFTIVEQ